MFNYTFNPKDITSKVQLGYHFPVGQITYFITISGLFNVPHAHLWAMLGGTHIRI